MNTSIIRSCSAAGLLGLVACTVQIGGGARPLPTPAEPVARPVAEPAVTPAARPGSVSLPPPTVPMTPGLYATVQSVSDTRYSNSSPAVTTTVMLRFSGDVVNRARSVVAARLITAMDDRGRRLAPAPYQNSTPGIFNSSTGGSVFTGSLALTGTSRQAEAIRYLDGEVDLFIPAGNEGYVLIHDLIETAGRPLEDPDLDRVGVKVTYLDARSYQTVRNNMSYGPTISDFVNVAVFYIQDPDNRLRSLALEDSSGRAISLQQRASSGDRNSALMQYALPRPLAPGTRIRLGVNLPEGIKTEHFRIENIPLP